MNQLKNANAGGASVGEYDANQVNLMRLRVNRINLIQSLNVDQEFLDAALRLALIDESDKAAINASACSKEDRARNLVDCLITKKKPVSEWYYRWRNMLTERGYRDLVTFMDNTIVKKPRYAEKMTRLLPPIKQIEAYESQMTFSSGNSKLTTSMKSPQVALDQRQHITSTMNSLNTGAGGADMRNFKQNIDIIEFDEHNFSQVRLKGNFERVVTGLHTYLRTYPTKLFEQLENSDSPDDAKQLAFEKETLMWFKKLELLYSLYKAEKNDQSLRDTFFLDTNVVHNVLDNFYAHLNMKYYKSLLDQFGIDMLAYFKEVLVERLHANQLIKTKYYENLDDLVNKLVWTFIRNERYALANQLLLEYLNYLNVLELIVIPFASSAAPNSTSIGSKTISVNELPVSKVKQKPSSAPKSAAESAKEQESSMNKITVMKAKFYTLCGLIVVKNHVMDFKGAMSYFNKASDMIEQLGEIGQEVDCTLLYYGFGTTLLEGGNFNKSTEYLNKSLMTLNYDAEILVDVIGSAILSYTSKWMLSKAESLAILAIQATRSFYETNHSQFVRALLYYCYFSNEFIQDETSIEICEYTLNLAKKVYGYGSIVVADAYRALSKALITNKIYSGDAYFEFAKQAHQIAVDCYGPTSNKLITYQVSLILALQTKAISEEIAENQETNQICLSQAHDLCMMSLDCCVSVYGPNNFSTAKLYRILGTLLYYMQKDDESEKIHKKSLEILQNLLSSDNLHHVFAKGILGLFYKLTGRVNDAASVLLEVVNSIKQEDLDSVISYCKWIPTIYSSLSECYRANGVAELADYYKQQADNLRLTATSKTVKYDIINVEMHRSPPYNLNEFLNELLTPPS